VFEAGKTGIT